MPVLTRTQQQRKAALQKVQDKKARAERQKTLEELRRLLDSAEVKDMLPDAKVKIADSVNREKDYFQRGPYWLYLTKSGLLKGWDEAQFRTGTGPYGGLGGDEYAGTEERTSRVEPSLEIVQKFGLTESKLQYVLAQLRA